MKIAWFDCFSGAAGDMLTASLLDAGLDKEALFNAIRTLQIEGLEIRTERVKRAGIASMRFEPVFPPQHHHRHLKDIVKIIQESKIAPKAKENAIGVFQILAEAEAAVHGTTPEKIHFHEVGALDSITDIVSFCVGIELLGIECVYASVLSVGGGIVQCDHGKMPVPAPATAEILKSFQIPFRGGPIEKELLTPTAAALLAHFVKEFTSAPKMKIESSGYGAGTMDAKEIANVTRVMIGTSEPTESSDLENDIVICMETNIDDVSCETIGYVTGLLFDNDALDVWTTPIYMKKNRPAVKLSVLCENQHADQLKDLLFRQGITLGIRSSRHHRDKLKREFIRVETDWGPVQIKVGILNGQVVFTKCEYEDCRRIALQNNLPIEQVVRQAMWRYKSEK